MNDIILRIVRNSIYKNRQKYSVLKRACAVVEESTGLGWNEIDVLFFVLKVAQSKVRLIIAKQILRAG